MKFGYCLAIVCQGHNTVLIKRLDNGEIEFWGADGDSKINVPRCYQKIAKDNKLLKAERQGDRLGYVFVEDKYFR